jgi:hypothetical protein
LHDRSSGQAVGTGIASAGQARLGLLDHLVDPLVVRRGAALLDAEVGEPEVLELGEAGLFECLAGAVEGAAVDCQDGGSRPGAGDDPVDMAADSGKSEHLSCPLDGQSSGGQVGNVSDVCRSGAGEDQFWGGAAGATGVSRFVWHSLRPLTLVEAAGCEGVRVAGSGRCLDATGGRGFVDVR